MLTEIKNIKASRKDLKSFGFTMAVVFMIFSAFLFYYGNYFYQNLLFVSVLFTIFGFIIPILLKPIYFVWMVFAVILGWIMTRVILSILFYVIITPIGLLSRLIGEDFLSLKSMKSDSYWNNRDSSVELNQDYKKQF